MMHATIPHATPPSRSHQVSMRFVSMPLQIVLKSSKIIPVMVGGRFITGKRYSAADYASAALLAAGVAVFSFAGGNAASAASGAGSAGAVVIGSGILAVTLCCDALLGNFQARRRRNTCGSQLVFAALSVQAITSPLFPQEKVMTEAGVSPLRMQLLQALFGAGLALALGAAAGAREPLLRARAPLLSALRRAAACSPEAQPAHAAAPPVCPSAQGRSRTGSASCCAAGRSPSASCGCSQAMPSASSSARGSSRSTATPRSPAARRHLCPPPSQRLITPIGVLPHQRAV